MESTPHRSPLTRLLSMLMLGVVVACLLAVPGAGRAQSAPPPPTNREFRGVWVCSVHNIDWPSEPGLSTAQQKAELIALLDRAHDLGINAIVFQVRPAGDALYPSKTEPWSHWLTGQQGRAPSPAWDPLAFAVEQSHARGMELHAWINPFRAQIIRKGMVLAPGHVSKRHPEFVREYGEHLWIDPGVPAAQQYALDVIEEIVRNYDVDGLHIDDYFYPYPIKDSANKTVPFPDDKSYGVYKSGGGTMGRDDWRRDNLNRFVKRAGEVVHRARPTTRYGISPFGIWKSGSVSGVGNSLDAYGTLYKDSRLWWREGYVDYMAPQLYWRADSKWPFAKLMAWWEGENVRKRHLWPGLFTSKISFDDKEKWSPSEITNQIAMVQGSRGSTGHIHFSARQLMRDAGLNASLQSTSYKEPALVPASPWLDAKAPAMPEASIASTPAGGRRATWQAAPGDKVFLFVVKIEQAGRWRTRIVPAAERSADLPATPAVTRVAVTAVDRVGNESAPRVLTVSSGLAAAPGRR